MKREEFLKNHQIYHLGVLPTEQPHPLTKGLSELAKEDLAQAVTTLKKVDLQALAQLETYAPLIEKMRQDVQEVLRQGGRIFLCGCGATGRLSLLGEFLWREKNNSDQAKAFMAGGDVALVHSLEGFEDYPEFGARHLKQMGFTENDLLIASTEGGETPYVIGATEAASQISKHKPYFLYCNPDRILKEKVERSRRVIENPEIQKICLFVGPMALSGSTRMQASTVLQLAIGCALIEVDQPVESLLKEFSDLVKKTSFDFLPEFIKEEKNTYAQGDSIIYCPHDFAITVFTDTTERSPTFSLPSFENDNYKGQTPSLCYISIPEATQADQAWKKLLLRDPIALDWVEIDKQTTNEYLHSFDFSQKAIDKRQSRIKGQQFAFEISHEKRAITLSFKNQKASIPVSTDRSLFLHTLLKLILNTHSTLMMGLMGRYQSNIMTWVTATNAKLIDRSARYIQTLLEESGQSRDYLEVVNRIYDCQPQLSAGECIVIKVTDSFKNSPKPQEL